MITVARLTAADRAAWGELAAGYKAFYNTPTSAAEYDEAWRRLMADDGVHALGARLDGILRSHMVLPNGTVRDTCVYSILPAEWPSVEAHLEHQLRRPR